MKKRSHRMLALALVLVLVALLPLQAHAAYTHQWSDSGVDYYGSLTATSTSPDKVRPSVTVRVTHTQGTASTISTGSSFSATSYAYTQLGSKHNGQVRTLLSKNNYVDSRTVYYAGASVTVPANSASGTYYLAVSFIGSRLTVNVVGYKTDSDGQQYRYSNDVYTSAFTPQTSSTSLSYLKG